VSSAIRWIARAKRGEMTPRPQGRRRGSRLDQETNFVFEMIEACPDITLNEMVGRLEAERSMRIGRSALSGTVRNSVREAGFVTG
jgi:transposase